MKYLTVLAVVILVMSITIPATLAASSSSSAIAIAGNGGTSTSISTSEAKDNGVAISNSKSDSSNGGSTTSISSSTAKNNEVVVSNSNAISPSPDSITTVTTVNSNTISSTTKTSQEGTYTNSNTKRDSFYYEVPGIKNVSVSQNAIENTNIINPSYVYTDKETINGTTFYIFNPTNITKVQSDVLVSPDKSINTKAVNGSNLTYSIKGESSSKPPSLIQMILNLFHL